MYIYIYIIYIYIYLYIYLYLYLYIIKHFDKVKDQNFDGKYLKIITFFYADLPVEKLLAISIVVVLVRIVLIIEVNTIQVFLGKCLYKLSE